LYRFLRGGSGLRYKPMEMLNLGVRGSGGTYQDMGQFSEAISEYRVALAAKPNDYDLRDYLALAYAHLRRFPEAESVMQETLRRAPSALRRIYLGDILLHAGRQREAQEILLGVMMSPGWNTLAENDKNRA